MAGPDKRKTGGNCGTGYATTQYHAGSGSDRDIDCGHRLAAFSYVAQTEREFIRQRQAEGIAAAKLRGVQFGRKPKEKPPEYPTVLEAWRRKELSARAAAVRLGVTHKTFQKWAE